MEELFGSTTLDSAVANKAGSGSGVNANDEVKGRKQEAWVSFRSRGIHVAWYYVFIYEKLERFFWAWLVDFGGRPKSRRGYDNPRLQKLTRGVGTREVLQALELESLK